MNRKIEIVNAAVPGFRRIADIDIDTKALLALDQRGRGFELGVTLFVDKYYDRATNGYVPDRRA